MNASVQKIETIFTNPYTTQAYVELAREIFGNMRLVAPNNFRKEFTNFSSHIEGSIHIGNYSSPDGKSIAIFAVQLKKASYVEGSRSTQRSYAKKLIESGNCDAAMVAFYTEGDTKWRLSFVRLDYEMKIENGKLKTAENITPAKRYSFLVGKDEPCHTAIERFRQFVVDNASAPTLDQLEEAFSVEKVTKEFFDLYSEKFFQLQEWLEGNEDFVVEANKCGFTSEQFAKKLMGQIVFLYFLQKKGWLGVNVWVPQLTEKEYKNLFYVPGAQGRIIKEHLPKLYVPQSDGTYRFVSRALDEIPDDDEEVIANHMVRAKTWGDGSKKFLRTIFDFSKKHKGHFFENYLEPLFYDTLNRNRGSMGYCPTLHCRIPFLSGGLFEPLDGYDWKSNNFDIPDEIFSNKVNDADRNGTGILDIFDRYNFTMSEDEPMEREVAIDPEMLGKIFENLLEVRDRKSKGAFYTPREIVHYMCQESLINYLVRKTGISENALRDFILYGDFMKDEDTTPEKRKGNGGLYISEEIFKLGEDGKPIVNRFKEIDDALATVRVADPAVGSGAFPLGMVNEIVRARQNITAYISINMNANAKRLMYKNERSPYALKYNAVKNSIFAADIEPSAVDIAQLRLWLSLVIDDEITPDAANDFEGHRNPLPLPNLECNIVCGNSLVDKLMGIELVRESDILHNETDSITLDFTYGMFDSILKKLLQAQDELFRCDEPTKKEQLKATIQSLKDTLIAEQLRGCNDDVIEAYNASKHVTSKPYVLWHLDFARVFRDNGGFDIVIGNPPYIQLQKCIDEETGTKLGDLYSQIGFKSFAKTGDIYCLFYEKGNQLLRENGILSFITSNKWMRAGYGKALRSYLASNTNPILLLDFAGQKIFESATVDVNILTFAKEPNQHKAAGCIAKEECRNNLSVYIRRHSTQSDFSTEDSWIILSDIEQSIKNKLISHGVLLKDWNIHINRGVITGLNEAFIITQQKRDELISLDPKSAEIIRPILRGRDIRRYKYEYADLWIIIAKFGSYKYLEQKYPAIYHHLIQYKEALQKRGQCQYTSSGKKNLDKDYCGQHHWLELDNNPSDTYLNDLSAQKIIWGEISDKPKFAIDIDGTYCPEATTFLMTGEHLKYLLCFLNSTLSEYYFAKYGTTTGMGTLRWKKYLIELLPVPRIDKEQEDMFEQVLEQLLSGSVELLEARQIIDSLIYQTLNLSKEEIDFIEQMIVQGAH